MIFTKKKAIGLAMAIANLSFTCVVAGVATYAWFSENQTVQATGMSISAAGPEISVEYLVLKYADDLKKGVIAYDNENHHFDFILPEYDEYIKARNVYSNLIVRAEITFGNTLDTSNKSINIDIYKALDSTLKADGKIRKITSNVAQFKCIATSYTLANSETVVPTGVGIDEVHVVNEDGYKDNEDAMYRSATAYFATRKTPTTFISLVNGQPVDPENGNKITLVPELFNVGIISKAVVYIECSYNEQLATGFVEDHPTEALHDLDGDITSIVFGIKGFESYGDSNTGKYLRMNKTGASYDGRYLPTHVGENNNQDILDGSKTLGTETIGSSTGINASNNKLSVSNYISSNKDSIYPANAIDNASFNYKRKNGTYQSENGHYIGNTTTTAGIISNSNPTNLGNSLSYSGNNAIVNSTAQPTMQMQYDSGNSKFAYYSSSEENISLYRYHENDMIDATLTGFTLTSTPTGDSANYGVGQYFELKGLSCMATYSKASGGTFTINVTTLCTYSTSPEGTLIPDQSVFTHPGNPKTITVTYTDGVTMSSSYNLVVIADTLESISITSPVTKLFYQKGDAFDTSGLTITGHFTVSGNKDVTNECTLSIGGVSYAHGAILNISGANLVVTVHYNGTASLGNEYEDRTFNITITDTLVNITEASEIIDVNDSFTVHFTYNANVTWVITNTTGTLSFSNSSTLTSATTTYTGSNYQNATGEIVVYGLAGGTATLTASVPGNNSDSCSFTIRDNEMTHATYTVTTKTSVTESGDVPSGSSATFLNNASSAVDQITSGKSMVLTLSGYSGYTISRIVLSVKSNASTGGGSFSACVGNTEISFIIDGKFNSSGWYGNWSTSYVDIEPAITTSKKVGAAEDVVITILASESSLYCESFTIYYEEPSPVTNVTILDGVTDITNGTKTISSGNIGQQSWTPTANVLYADSTSDHAVTWDISAISSGTISIDENTGTITLGSASGTATVRATTVNEDSNGAKIRKTFTLTWSNLQKILQSIELSGTYPTTFNKDDSFSSTGLIVTANYNDGSSGTVTPTSITGYNMSTTGQQTVTVSYTENGVTVSATYDITVNGGGGQTENIIYTLDGTITGGNSGYADASDITQSTILWHVTGNTTMSPWRIGGKNLTNVDRPVASTVAVTSSDVTKVIVTIGSKTATFNSITLKVGTAEGDSSISNLTINSGLNANATLEFTRPNNTSWANRYFTVVFNVSCGNSNQYVQLSSIDFYAMS